jgi:hypothetical protein
MNSTENFCLCLIMLYVRAVLKILFVYVLQGASVIRMMKFFLGDSTFKQGLQVKFHYSLTTYICHSIPQAIVEGILKSSFSQIILY